MKWNSQLASPDITLAANKMKTFFEAIKGYLPTAVTISWDGLAQWYDDYGKATDQLTYTAPTPTTGTGASAYSGASGVVVNWNTGAYINGRRLRGRSFFVPCATTNVYETDGTIVASCLGAFTTAANNLIAGDPLLVIRHGVVGQLGDVEVVLTANVPDKAAVLRSRRD